MTCSQPCHLVAFTQIVLIINTNNLIVAPCLVMQYCRQRHRVTESVSTGVTNNINNSSFLSKLFKKANMHNTRALELQILFYYTCAFTVKDDRGSMNPRTVGSTHCSWFLDTCQSVPKTFNSEPLVPVHENFPKWINKVSVIIIIIIIYTDQSQH